MPRPINLQRCALCAGTAASLIAATALGALAVALWNAGAVVAATAVGVGAIGVGIIGVVVTAAYCRRLRLAISSATLRASAIANGEPTRRVHEPMPTDFGSLFDALSTIEQHQRILQVQAEAIEAGALDAAVLSIDSDAPAIGALKDSVEGLRHTTSKLRDLEALHSSVVDNIADAVAVVAEDGRIVASNSTCDRVLASFEGDLERALPRWRELDNGRHDLPGVSAAEVPTLTRISVHRLITSEGTLTALCWRDLAGESAVEAQVEDLSLTDLSTGLLNRHGLLAALDRHHALGTHVTLIHVGLVGFSSVNRRHGFAVGDAALLRVSERFRSMIREGDAIARLGGDEFVVVVESSDTDVSAIADRIVACVAEPIAVRDMTIELEAHIGWAQGRVDDRYELLRHATTALSESRSSDERIVGYRLVAETDDRRLEAELRRAVELDQFELYGQPIVDIFERRVLGIEVLLRWRHPSGRIIDPSEFLPGAEASGLIADIDRWVVRRCLETAAQTNPSVVFSVNISPSFLASVGAPDFVQSCLESTGVPSGRIQVDVAEGDVVTDDDRITRAVRQLQGLGVKVALDDVGLDDSSLMNAFEMEVATIKIDRAMVSAVSSDAGRETLASILAYARSHQVTVVAEGVESSIEVAELAELGCRYQQGFFHARPAPLVDVLASIDRMGFDIGPDERD